MKNNTSSFKHNLIEDDDNNNNFPVNDYSESNINTDDESVVIIICLCLCLCLYAKFASCQSLGLCGMSN